MTAESARPYTQHGALTAPGEHAYLYDPLPRDVRALRAIVADLIVHVSWAARYGLAGDASLVRATLPVAERLGLIQAAQPGPLSMPRPPSARTSGTCRDYALLLCSMLRHHSVPARVRCGFATYFSARPYQDHWTCEYWNGRRWAVADAQIDQLQSDHLGIDFDCVDLPPSKFLNAGQAWSLVRSSRAEPSDFGHDTWCGLWFMRVNLARDALALANREISWWDSWRAASEASKVLSDEDLKVCDWIAAQTALDAASAGPPGAAVVESLHLPPWERRT